VSALEAASERAPGKLSAPDELPRQVAAQSFTRLSVGIEHGHEVRQLRCH
jgi:hypothetical protein